MQSITVPIGLNMNIYTYEHSPTSHLDSNKVLFKSIWEYISLLFFYLAGLAGEKGIQGPHGLVGQSGQDGHNGEKGEIGPEGPKG